MQSLDKALDIFVESKVRFLLSEQAQKCKVTIQFSYTYIANYSFSPLSFDHHFIRFSSNNFLGRWNFLLPSYIMYNKACVVHYFKGQSIVIFGLDCTSVLEEYQRLSWDTVNNKIRCCILRHLLKAIIVCQCMH